MLRILPALLLRGLLTRRGAFRILCRFNLALFALVAWFLTRFAALFLPVLRRFPLLGLRLGSGLIFRLLLVLMLARLRALLLTLLAARLLLPGLFVALLFPWLLAPLLLLRSSFLALCPFLFASLLLLRFTILGLGFRLRRSLTLILFLRFWLLLG